MTDPQMPQITSPVCTVECPTCSGTGYAPMADPLRNTVTPCVRCERSGRVYETALTDDERTGRRKLTPEEIRSGVRAVFRALGGEDEKPQPPSAR